MSARFKIFVQIMMILLALDLSSPEATCFSNLSQVTQSGCCGGGMVCKCHHDQVGSHSCNVTQTPASDKSIPARTAYAHSPQVGVPLLTVASARERDLVSQVAFALCGPNASPPFSGRSPQVILRLWLI